MQTLQEITSQLESIHDDEDTRHVLYAAEVDGEWCPSSPAVVVSLSTDGEEEEPEEVDGAVYLLEANLALEAIEHYRQYGPGPAPTMEELCRAVIYYAVNDCYGPYPD